MRPRFDRLPPVVTARCRWVKGPDGSWSSGNVLIKRVPEAGTVHDNWLIFLRVGRRLVRVHPRSRPWGYGSAGRAKIGATHCPYPLEGR